MPGAARAAHLAGNVLNQQLRQPLPPEEPILNQAGERGRAGSAWMRAVMSGQFLLPDVDLLQRSKHFQRGNPDRFTEERQLLREPRDAPVVIFIEDRRWPHHQRRKRLPRCQQDQRQTTVQAMMRWFSSRKDWLLIVETVDESLHLPGNVLRSGLVSEKVSLPVTPRHGFPVHQGNPTPNPRAICPACSTASLF